jgi:hypothetical protein
MGHRAGDVDMNRPFASVGSESPVFDGFLAVCWFVSMTSNCADARVKHITPGVLYTFVFTQDAAGKNVFDWPSSFINPPMVSLTPNAVTTANFIGTIEGNLISNVPGARS